MASDDDEDLYNEEFDFVDEEDDADDGDDASNVEEVAATVADNGDAAKDAKDADNAVDEGSEAADDDAPPKPATDHVVHLYECRKFTRTINRPFTAEDAEAFASDYNKSAKSYARFAVAGKEDAKPKKSID